MSNDTAHQLTNREARIAFNQEALAAIEKGLITRDEAHTIARTGHRKNHYWNRHLIDLRNVIADRVRQSELPTSEVPCCDTHGT